MQLVDINLNKNVLGRIMHAPGILTNIDYDISPSDFYDRLPQMVFVILRAMKEHNINDEEYTPATIDMFIRTYHENVAAQYDSLGGLEFVKSCFSKRIIGKFDTDYQRLKKLALLRTLKKRSFDISYFYKENPDTVAEEMEIMERFENATMEDILNKVEGNLNEVREHYLKGGTGKGGNIAEGIVTFVRGFEKAPEIGYALNGDIFSSACRGARLGKFYLRSGASGTGKSRLSVYDSCRIAFPEHWSEFDGDFIREQRPPHKTLLVTTEQDSSEMKTIILSYLSGINETTIITGLYSNEEERARVDYAMYLLDKYSGYYFIDEISDPDLNNVSNCIRKYITLYDVQYIFYDYIFTSPSLLAQFSGSKIREDVALGMMANQLKQLAKDYNVFIASSTQLNGDGMGSKPGFKGETCLRGAKALADKVDMGCIAQEINKEEWTKELSEKYSVALANGVFDESTMIAKLQERYKQTNNAIWIEKAKPTHVIDIYKMRRGQYKNVRIWYYINLGTGERYDLFMTNAGNSILDNQNFDIFKEREEIINENWHEIGKEFALTHD